MNHDPAPPATEADLNARLSGLGIAFETHTHDPVFTVGEAQALRNDRSTAIAPADLMHFAENGPAPLPLAAGSPTSRLD